MKRLILVMASGVRSGTCSAPGPAASGTSRSPRRPPRRGTAPAWTSRRPRVGEQAAVTAREAGGHLADVATAKLAGVTDLVRERMAGDDETSPAPSMRAAGSGGVVGRPEV